MRRPGRKKLKQALEALYEAYNLRQYVSPDPLQFVYDYPKARDREIAALVAALLAYGKVSQILIHVEKVLAVLGPSPFGYLTGTAPETIARDLAGFQYRFTRAEHMISLLVGVQSVLERFGSLEACFLDGFDPGQESVIPAMSAFIKHLSGFGETGILVADPDRKSACKRNNLFLRWMVRRDAVDPGGWDGVPASHLVVPLDRHMHRAGILLGFTSNGNASLKTALEITRGFRELAPDDPVRYDFSLTRFGIRDDMSADDLAAFLAGPAGR